MHAGTELDFPDLVDNKHLKFQTWFDADEVGSFKLDSEAWMLYLYDEAGLEVCCNRNSKLGFRSLDSEAWMRGGCDEVGVGFDAIEIRA